MLIPPGYYWHYLALPLDSLGIGPLSRPGYCLTAILIRSVDLRGLSQSTPGAIRPSRIDVKAFALFGPLYSHVAGRVTIVMHNACGTSVTLKTRMTIGIWQGSVPSLAFLRLRKVLTRTIFRSPLLALLFTYPHALIALVPVNDRPERDYGTPDNYHHHCDFDEANHRSRPSLASGPGRRPGSWGREGCRQRKGRPSREYSGPIRSSLALKPSVRVVCNDSRAPDQFAPRHAP